MTSGGGIPWQGLWQDRAHPRLVEADAQGRTEEPGPPARRLRARWPGRCEARVDRHVFCTTFGSPTTEVIDQGAAPGTDNGVIATTSTCPVDLNDELWTWRHIAAWVHRQRAATYRLTVLPGFPAPLDLGGDAVWVASEVKEFLLARRAPARRTRPTAVPPVASARPATAVVRPRRRGRRPEGIATHGAAA